MDGSIVGVVVVLVVPVDLGIVDCHTTGRPRRNPAVVHRGILVS